MPTFSIVIPVYNAEAFLEECIDSVLGQTFGDFEAVCVDDGSTDSSLDMLRAFAEADGRIRVVAQANGGSSSARNAGIREAAGRFIVFLDCDDALEASALETLAAALEPGDVDAIVFGWSCFGGEPDRWLAEQSSVPDALYPEFTPELVFEQPTQPFLRVAVRKSVLDEHGIAFDEELYLGEDAAFLIGLYPHARGVRLISDKLYRYRMPHVGSIMQGVSGDAAEESLQGLNTVISVYGRWARDGLLGRYADALIAWTVKYSLYTTLRQDEPLRAELCTLMRDLWLAHFTADELRALDIPRHAKRLVLRVVDQDASNPTRDLLAYRLAEYGLADLARTALNRLR